MGMTIVLKTELFRGDWDHARSQYSMLWYMEALCRTNQSHIRQFRHLFREGKIEKPYPRIYKSGIHYERERGTEEWLDIPTILKGGSYPGEFPGPWGDCLPVSTLVLHERGVFLPIGQVAVGDRIMGQGGWTEVKAHAVTGSKPILSFLLSNRRALCCSPEHRLFTASGNEIRAERVVAGQKLLGLMVSEATVEDRREISPQVCCDITTDSGRFWLPESDLIVHNCEDLACWRVAELRERPKKFGGPVKARPFAKFRRREDGSFAYHALLMLPSGRLEDPSLTMGMTWEKDFYTQDIAKKYMRGELPIQVRYAEPPDTVVVDPESPSGFSSDIHGARKLVGLEGPNICTNATGEEIAAWGYNRGSFNESQARDLRRVMKAFRSGNPGRLGTIAKSDSRLVNQIRRTSRSTPNF